MAVLKVCCVLTVTLLAGILANSHPKCPPDYRTRVETCITEAQVAPQAGGGITLVADRDRIGELCDQGLLQKTIDCLQEVHTRCADNETIVHDLNKVFSVAGWQKGAKLLCDHKEDFQNNFDCFYRSGHIVATCIISRTQMFKQEVISADLENHAGMIDITCRYAENVVKCLRRPLVRGCPADLVETMVEALHSFLPPTCLLTEEYSETEDDEVLPPGREERESPEMNEDF